MINEFTQGLNNGKRGKEIKTFPEKYEINLRKIISTHLQLRNLIGEIDVDKLIFDIMEFHENNSNRRHTR